MKGIFRHNWFGWLSFVIVAGYLVVGLWPFDFHPLNQVGWLPDRSGLYFKPYGIAYDPAPLPVLPGLSGAARSPGDFTVELWIVARHEPANNIFDILTVYNPRLPYDFTLCQWQQDFLLRATTRSKQRTAGIPEAGVDDALPEGKPQFITVRGDEAGTDFFLNGKAAEHFPDFVLNTEALDGQLILGNDAAGKQPWTGNLLGLAIYNRAFDAAEIARQYALWMQGHAAQLTNVPGLRALYLLEAGRGQRANDSSGNGHYLVIPEIFQPVHRDFLIAPWKDVSYRHLDYSDIVINILGFMPFGFCFFFYCRRLRPGQQLTNILFVVLTGTAISLTIEITQAWLPNRVSSSMDLFTNTAGTLLGVALALAIGPMFRTSKL